MYHSGFSILYAALEVSPSCASDLLFIPLLSLHFHGPVEDKPLFIPKEMTVASLSLHPLASQNNFHFPKLELMPVVMLFIGPQVVNEDLSVKPGTMPVQNISNKFDDWEADCVQSSYSPEKQVIYKEFTRYEYESL